MAKEPAGIREVFDQAQELAAPAQRAAYLDEACAGRPELRREVELLLRALDRAGDFLTQPAEADLRASPPDPGETTVAAGTDPVPPGAGQPGAAAARELDFLQPGAKPGVPGHFLHYEVREVLGRGAFGIVLRAFDEKLHRLVAVKVLAAQLAEDAAARQRFLREARAAAAVSSEHVVAVYAVGERPVPFLVMEYVAGRTLQQVIDERGALGLPEVLRIGHQIAAGLAAAHAQELIHRDVKPANILLENGERARITDFGLAKAVDDVSLTQSGVITGTPLYMSPEQARGQPVDQRSDLFSLGSVLYTLCTGQPPFAAAKQLGVLKRVCEDTPRPIRAVNPAIPIWLTAVVGKLLAKDPGRRFQTAAEVADLLRQHLAHLRDPSLPAPPPFDLGPETVDHLRPVGKGPGPKRAALRRWRTWLAVGGVAALVAAGLASLPLLRHGAPDGGTSAEQQNAELPANAEQAEALARELLKDGAVRWTVVPAADLKSTGATLTQRPDRSILVSGTDAEADVYTLTLTDLPPTVSALRLEALRDPRLPSQGPGRHPSGEFLLAEVVLYHAGAGADSPVTAVPIVGGAADSAADGAPVEQAYDDNPATGWRLRGEPGETHWAIFQLREPLRFGPGDRLVVRLEHAPRGGAANLGRFRLAVSEDPAAFEAYRLQTAARQAGLRGFAALGAAYFCRADYSRAVEALARAVQAVPEPGPTELLLLALAHQELQQGEQARPPHDRAMALLPRHPMTPLLSLLVPRALVRIEGRSPAEAEARRAELVEAQELARLTAAIGGAPNNKDGYWTRGAWYACRARWRECAKDFLAVLELDLGDREAWEVVAAARILVGDAGSVGKLFDRLKGEAFSANDDMPWWTCHIRCQVGQLWPEGVPLDRLPLAELDQWLERGGGAGWNLPRLQVDRARVAYRRGKYEEAIEWCGKALELGEKDQEYRKFKEQADTQVYAVRAMAEYRLQRYDDARQSFATATGLIPAEVRALANGKQPDTRPVGAGVMSGDYLADWLVAEVYRRQVERLLLPNLPAFLKGEYRPGDNEERLTLAVACRARGLHGTAAGLYADAFAAEPKRAEDRKAGHRFVAACCAARAGRGHSGSREDPEKVRWRGQALRWLKDDLAARTRQRENGPPADRTEVWQAVRQWQVEPDLVRVRDPFWIAAQPADERREWEKLWAGAAALAATAGSKQPTEEASATATEVQGDARELAALTAAVKKDIRSADAYLARATWYARRGRWEECAQDHLACVELTPNDLHAWLAAGASLVLAGDLDGHRRLCDRLAKEFRDTPEGWQAEVVCKVHCLLPGKIDAARLPLERLDQSVESGQAPDWLRPWTNPTRGLVAYRAGDFEQAVRWTRKSQEIGASVTEGVAEYREMCGALALLVRALAEYRLRRPDDARRSFQEAAALVPAELRVLGTSGYRGKLPVDAAVVERDWLIAEVLRREAEGLLFPKGG
jgi:tetratricopeptide (TPR) repeat protein